MVVMIGKNTMLVRYSVKKFDGSGNFRLCQIRVKDMVVEQVLIQVSRGRDSLPTLMKDFEWAELDEHVTGAIRICVDDKILFNIFIGEFVVMLWEKLEGLCMSKSLTTRLLLKQ
ncbi:hypothetical protein KSP39_PZI017212 [Platanthera zijinensis]|uniref:Uncharacterized protein n=1 Tax=Platanthera zijinensis TaxID=2320716 RepID=A0AAP0B6N8_9ASPA